MSTDEIIQSLALAWFLLCWIGYARYAMFKARNTPCLANVMHSFRLQWMEHLLRRENRIADANVIGNLERSAAFFASSTLIILAGVITVLGSSDRAVSVLADLPMVEQASRGLSEVKLLALGVVFVYAFFTFSWCMRQYNFVAVLVGAAPNAGTVGLLLTPEQQAFVSRTSSVISRAANQFNNGLRSYYFGLSLLAWFISPWALMVASAVVTLVLYRREFHSAVLDVMLHPHEIQSIRKESQQ
jgi:uncharacterized membrane protein